MDAIGGLSYSYNRPGISLADSTTDVGMSFYRNDDRLTTIRDGSIELKTRGNSYTTGGVRSFVSSNNSGVVGFSSNRFIGQDEVVSTVVEPTTGP